MKTNLLILCIIVFSFFAKTSHTQGLLGGEIYWESISPGNPNTGKFIFHLVVYQSCYNDSAANPILDSTQILHSNSLAANITLSISSGYPKDLSPNCNADTNFAHTNCQSPSFISAFNGAYKVYDYSCIVMLNAIPPISGWTFYWNGGNRNSSMNLSANQTMRLRSIMHPFNNHNVYPSFDNCPTASESPIITTCNGYNFKYIAANYDQELDSMYFNWGEPIDSNGIANTFISSYQFTNPLPGPIHNPNNSGAIINHLNGSINFIIHNAGGYFATQRIRSYKCGTLVAEIFREMYFLLDSCGTNVSPIFHSPFANSSFVDSVFAGDSITYLLSFTDTQYLSTNIQQTVYVTSFSRHFGDYISSTSSSAPTYSPLYGCINPPCATLNAAPIDSIPIAGQGNAFTVFNWQTDCNHLFTNVGCGVTSNVYTFFFKYYDDHCPIPAVNYGSFTVAILPKPSLPPPILDSVSVNNSNGDANIYWQQPIDSINIFNKYFIYHSNDINGPFILIDSLLNLSDSTYTHIGANAHNQKCFYKMRTQSFNGFIIKSSFSNTVNNGYIDLEIITLFNPYANSNLNVIFYIKNNSAETIDSAIFKYMQSDSSIITEIIPIAISSGNVGMYPFTQTYIPNLNSPFQLCASVEILNDMDTSNNYKCITVPVSIMQTRNSDFNLINIAPNPANDFISISFNLPSQSLITIEFFDIYGRLICTNKIKSQKGKNTYKKLLQNFEAGVYFFKISNNIQSLRGKIIVE